MSGGTQKDDRGCAVLPVVAMGTSALLLLILLI